MIGKSCWSLSFVLFLASVHVGCAVLTERLPGRAPAYSQEELRHELGSFASYFHVALGAVADSIAETSSDRRVRKRALTWKVNAIPLVQEAALDPNPQEAYVSLMTLMVLMRNYLEGGEGGAIFGEQQARVVPVIDALYEELLEIGAKFLSEKELEYLVSNVEEFARKKPIVGKDFAMQSVRRSLVDVEQTNIFQQVVAIPLSPFRALSGVGDSSDAIREFTVTAREFVRAAERMPEMARWQVELLLYDFEDRDTVMDSVASLQALGSSASRMSESIARLPDDMRAMLGESGESLARVEQVLARANDVAGPLREAAQSIQLASASWETILDGDDEPAPAAGESSFEIAEWESAAREFGRTATQLRELAIELRELGNGRGPLPQVSAAVGEADNAARGLIDLAAWRGLQLSVAFFVLLLGYRLIASRIPSR